MGPVVELGGQGGQSRTFSVVLHNKKSARQNTPIVVLRITSTRPEFKVLPNSCLGTISAGETCSVPLVFTPSKMGPHTGGLVIIDNTPAHSHDVILTGRGVQGAMGYGPKSLPFGRVSLHQSSPPKYIQVKNPNPVTLGLGAITSSNPDFALSGDCDTTLLPNQSCQVKVTFVPSIKGSQTTTITIEDNARRAPHVVHASGKGM